MTIFKVHSNFIYFSHIPKCAGSSIEDYFSTFPACSVLFLDREFYSSSLKNWAKSSPQHILGNVVERLFDNSFFTDYLAIIREPIDRFKSTFKYQKYWLKNIDEAIDCNVFVSEILPNNYQKQDWCDNHFQTQISFLIPNRKYKLFLMDKDGIREAKRYIDQNIFAYDREIEIPRNNTANDLYSNKVEDIKLNLKSIEIIKELYKNDFNLFKELNKKYSSLEKSFFVFSKDNFRILNNENFLLENQLLKDTTEELKNTTEELKNKNAELKNITEELKNKNEELKNKNQELKNTTEELKNKNQELKNTTEELKNKNEELKNKNKVLNESIDEFKKALFSIQESRIWRYSYNFRRVMDKLRNLKN